MNLGFRPLTFISWVNFTKKMMWFQVLCGPCSIFGFRVLRSYSISLQPCVYHILICTATCFFITPFPVRSPTTGKERRDRRKQQRLIS
ncbi:hypothetical protein BGY98DRAFT_1013061 [Russula aff. rugulosa BPL654]|nr:hypothetical protein BGY98DRAFT_1013061 [Russula aff. rugulosa BPL654]